MSEQEKLNLLSKDITHFAQQPNLVICNSRSSEIIKKPVEKPAKKCHSIGGVPVAPKIRMFQNLLSADKIRGINASSQQHAAYNNIVDATCAEVKSIDMSNSISDETGGEMKLIGINYTNSSRPDLDTILSNEHEQTVSNNHERTMSNSHARTMSSSQHVTKQITTFEVRQKRETSYYSIGSTSSESSDDREYKVRQ